MFKNKSPFSHTTQPPQPRSPINHDQQVVGNLMFAQTLATHHFNKNKPTITTNLNQFSNNNGIITYQNSNGVGGINGGFNGFRKVGAVVDVDLGCDEVLVRNKPDPSNIDFTCN